MSRDDRVEQEQPAPEAAAPAGSSTHAGSRRRLLRGYSLAVVAVALALVIRLLLDPWLRNQSPYIVFIVAVAVTGLYGGVRAAWLATVLGAVVAYFCFIPPRYAWGFAGVGDAVAFGVYLLASIAVILLTDARIRAARKAQRSLEQQLAAERRVVDAESLFRHFMDNSPTCAFLRDEQGHCVYANATASRELGMGLSAASMAPDRDRASEFHEQDQQVLKTGRAMEFLERTSGEGAERWWLTSKFPFVDQSGRRFVGGIALEITDRQQAEEILRKTESLSAAGQMAALLAHEINNPLAALTNLMFLLNQQPLDPLARDLVMKARAALERINRIAGTTLGFYFEKDAPAPLPIRAVMDEAIDLLHSTEEFHRVRFVRDYQWDGTIVASQPRIRQLVLALLTNAVESGAQTVRLRLHMSSDWRRERRGVRIVVADDGCGIAPDLRPRIFDPFFSTKSEKGSGLGLWASRAIAYRNGGFISLRSATNGARRGTSVAVFLPAPNAASSITRATEHAFPVTNARERPRSAAL